MVKGVLTAKEQSSYDDVIEEKYHFPRNYLARIEQMVGDLVVYYEPRRRDTGETTGGRQSYFASALVEEIIEDTQRPDHFYALVSNFLPFFEPVPFRVGQNFYESSLVRKNGETNRGAFRHAVRVVPDHEFEAILAAGLSAPTEPWEEIEVSQGFAEVQEEYKRPLVEQVLLRPYRDRTFSKLVRRAYTNTCAVSGLSLKNGGGRPEVQAAHIKPVAADGPDSVRNGIALCGTAHWMFDRGIISVANDYSIMISSRNRSEDVLKMINPKQKLLIPDSELLRPHAKFLDYHRSVVFKP